MNYAFHAGVHNSLEPCMVVTNICIFNVHGSMHCNNILVYKSQQDGQVTEFIFV